MWDYIRKKLGIWFLEDRIGGIKDILRRLEDNNTLELAEIRTKQDAILSGIGRILAHVGDKAFTKSPHDPKTIAESKEIGEKAIEAEAKVRAHYGYDK